MENVFLFLGYILTINNDLCLLEKPILYKFSDYQPQIEPFWPIKNQYKKIPKIESEDCIRNKIFMRSFNHTNNFSRFKCLRYTEYVEKLFCWNCLIGEDRNSGNCFYTGFTDIKYATRACQRHESSKIHKMNTIKLAEMRKSALNSEKFFWRHIKTTEVLEKNEKQFTILARSAIFLIKRGLAFRDDFKKTTENRGNFEELYDLMDKFSNRNIISEKNIRF